jgi:hypothetical protein
MPREGSRGEFSPLIFDQAAFESPRTWSDAKAEPTCCFS